jgi:hypothetical protein
MKDAIIGDKKAPIVDVEHVEVQSETKEER